MMWLLDSLLKDARRLNASDIHLVRGMAPAMRIAGEIQSLDGEPLDEATLRRMLDETATAAQIEKLNATRQLCCSFERPEIGRFRFSVYFRSGCPELAIRLCEPSVRSAIELELPPIIDELAHLSNGLVLVTGPTGVGKTTTLNYLIHSINRQRRAKIITIEDPIEFVHTSDRSIVVQQEVLTDVPSFQSALVHSLRQDPDVIVIGEMRDLETIGTALIAAETGHLVLATLHTPDAAQTVQRIFSVFPAEQQNAIVVQLANSLQVIVAQKLLPRVDDSGRVLACEVCIATPAVRAHIRERQVHLLNNEMQTGKKFQMQTMDGAILNLFQCGTITGETALSNARDIESMRRRIVN
jgi:twitching motility protein PilT